MRSDRLSAILNFQFNFWYWRNRIMQFEMKFMYLSLTKMKNFLLETFFFPLRISLLWILTFPAFLPFPDSHSPPPPFSGCIICELWWYQLTPGRVEFSSPFSINPSWESVSGHANDGLPELIYHPPDGQSSPDSPRTHSRLSTWGN